MSENSPLKWIAFETTKRCNLNCVHCRSKNTDLKYKDIDKKNVFLLMERVAEFSKPVFVLSGGEPLLRSDIFEIASYGNGLGFKMAMATNGMLINDDICKKINESGIRICSISLDGSNSDIHDSFRRQHGSFDGVVKATEIFKRHNIPFIINSSFTKKNQSDIENTYRLAKKLGASAWYMFIVLPVGNAKDDMEEIITKEDYEKILEWHFDMEISEKDMKVRPTCAPSYYRIFAEKAKKLGKNLERRNLSFSPDGSKGCVAAESIAYIDAYGNFYPCSYFSQSAGNIFEKSVKELWNSEIFSSIRDTSKYIGDCGVCEYKKICQGCRVRSAVYNGNYLSKDPFCDYKPKNNH
ncbi:MAG: radical SAM protein [Elusimicrobia bacterium]|jgi:radical SAM protein with 4Fe4S-binding SPASM domain|nr:radical SAM protein [Elusimicrobiota bacterium]